LTDGGREPCEELGESELAARGRAGDRAAFEAIVHRSGRWVFARLYLQTGDAHRAEDLTQETFFTAWQQIGELVDPAAFRGWLWAIAQRKLLDAAKHQNRRKRWGRRAPAGEIDSAVHPGASPVSSVQEKEQCERAMEMLRALPEEYRVPLALRYLGGADYETISRQLALSNGSLRGLLQRGMAMLREKMAAEEGVGGRR
jgi:RNA polymerase sigma-70 factor, ECF subfamily